MSSAAHLGDRDPDLQPLCDVLLAVAGELERIRSLGFRLEFAVCALALRVEGPAAGAQELQQLDLLLQQIGALREFLGALPQAIDPKAHVQISAALERIGLADMKSRLAGCDWVVAPSGSFEVF